MRGARGGVAGNQVVDARERRLRQRVEVAHHAGAHRDVRRRAAFQTGRDGALERHRVGKHQPVHRRRVLAVGLVAKRHDARQRRGEEPGALVEIEAAVEEVLDSGAVDRRVSGAIEVDALVALEVLAGRAGHRSQLGEEAHPFSLPVERQEGRIPADGVFAAPPHLDPEEAAVRRRRLALPGEREADIDGGRSGGAPVLERHPRPLEERHREVAVELAARALADEQRLGSARTVLGDGEKVPEREVRPPLAVELEPDPEPGPGGARRLDAQRLQEIGPFPDQQRVLLAGGQGDLTRRRALRRRGGPRVASGIEQQIAQAAQVLGPGEARHRAGPRQAVEVDLVPETSLLGADQRDAATLAVGNRHVAHVAAARGVAVGHERREEGGDVAAEEVGERQVDARLRLAVEADAQADRRVERLAHPEAHGHPDAHDRARPRLVEDHRLLPLDPQEPRDRHRRCGRSGSPRGSDCCAGGPGRRAPAGPVG